MRERSLKNVREGTFRTVAWKRLRGTMGDETVTRERSQDAIGSERLRGLIKPVYFVET